MWSNCKSFCAAIKCLCRLTLPAMGLYANMHDKMKENTYLEFKLSNVSSSFRLRPSVLLLRANIIHVRLLGNTACHFFISAYTTPSLEDREQAYTCFPG